MPGADGGADAAERMRERARRIRDLSPPLKVFGEVIIKATADSFQASKEVDGPEFRPLAASTIIARHLKRRGGRPKGFSGRQRISKQGRLLRSLRELETGAKSRRGGRLTDAAKLTRMEAVISQAGITTLVDTGRLKNSALRATTMRGKNTLVWSAVGYGGPHITGGKRSGAALMSGAGAGFPPKRNFSVFDGEPGKMHLKPAFAKRLDTMIKTYVEFGTVA